MNSKIMKNEYYLVKGEYDVNHVFFGKKMAIDSCPFCGKKHHQPRAPKEGEYLFCPETGKRFQALQDHGCPETYGMDMDKKTGKHERVYNGDTSIKAILNLKRHS